MHNYILDAQFLCPPFDMAVFQYRSCTCWACSGCVSVPLVHVLGMHIKVLSESYYADVWSELSGDWAATATDDDSAKT